MRSILTVAGASLLAACGSEPANETAPPETNMAWGTNHQEAVLKLSDRQRNVVMVRAILDAGLQCQGVTESERVRDYEGAPTWAATCTDGRPHLITISPDGTARVVSPTR